MSTDRNLRALERVGVDIQRHMTLSYLESETLAIKDVARSVSKIRSCIRQPSRVFTHAPTAVTVWLRSTGA